ncbi:hypothetical protein [Cupriavidus pinatubonensis]|uniref:hypothetical protein n=1 Tax=Cupriavidus pinatubonensis TaxID=248026 RepID=UPI001CC38CFB|nr:hypothetical protein [Cupriavidus pinatubonensis]
MVTSCFSARRRAVAEKPVADVVFECVGVPGLIPQIMRAMPPRSRVTVALA